MKTLTLLAIFLALPAMAQAPNQERSLASAVIYEQALTIKAQQQKIEDLTAQLKAKGDCSVDKAK